jgi:hypothetical protein
LDFSKVPVFWVTLYYYSLRALKLLTALKYATYSLMCQGSVVEDVNTFKIYKIATFVKISLRSQLVTSAAVHGVAIIVFLTTGGIRCVLHG